MVLKCPRTIALLTKMDLIPSRIHNKMKVFITRVTTKETIWRIQPVVRSIIPLEKTIK
tara:strand:+ start:371 stop:544 length:174 start_codon:yes stop_codon:yes gene_type:complete